MRLSEGEISDEDRNNRRNVIKLASESDKFDLDSPLGNRIVDKAKFKASLDATGKYDKVNSNGKKIVEKHSNKSVSIEIEEEGNKRGRRLQTYPSIESSIAYSSDITIMYDPPDRSFSPCALALYTRANFESAKIYYEFEEPYSQVVDSPTLYSAYTTWGSPYIHLNTPFGATRNRTVEFIAVYLDGENLVRSNPIRLKFIVEADARPLAFGFLVPGVETNGYFVKFVIEMKAAARAQVAGGQEFADFYTELGVGTYDKQVIPLKLNDITSNPTVDADLTGFEGGFTVNCTRRLEHYGILVPYHSGTRFHGKVVRIDILNMGEEPSQVAACAAKWRMETYDANGNIVVTGPSSAADACVFILDLESLHKDARGFKRGFVNYPYAFLSPGQFNIPIRINVCDFGLHSTLALDLGTVSKDYGGYSGGFSDGPWSCFNPLRTYTGPFGGIRSTQAVDNGHFRPYFHSEVLCIHENGWNSVGRLNDSIRSFDLGNVDVSLRGFSEALRVGRYAYLSPLSERTHSYAGKVVRIFLGTGDIGTTLDYLAATGGKIRDIVDILDLKLVDNTLAGFSGLFSSGKYLFLVPFRNENEPINGQRGHGSIVRLDMNNFDVGGVTILPMTGTTRSQIPSFADEDLRGFSGGFGSGKYGVIVPFYNAIFSGKLARFIGIADDMSTNLQELNLVIDRDRPETYKGFRGGFVSLWQGVYDL